MNVVNPLSRRLLPVVSAVTIALFAAGCGGDEPDTAGGGAGNAGGGSAKPAGQAPRSLGDTGSNLLFQTTHPNHKEFVQVRTYDPQELDALHQWDPVVLSLFQYTILERQ